MFDGSVRCTRQIKKKYGSVYFLLYMCNYQKMKLLFFVFLFLSKKLDKNHKNFLFPRNFTLINYAVTMIIIVITVFS
jgi:hypothetical protein